jgi:hypothetical protein
MAKATFTAGGYGSGRGSEKAMGAGGTVPATIAVMEKYGLKTRGEWDPEMVRANGKVGGYKPLDSKDKEVYDKAVKIANQMRDNLEAHPSTQFTSNIRDMVKQVAGSDFVFVNPVDGYRLSLDKHNTKTVQKTIGGQRLRVEVPEAKLNKKTGEKESTSVNVRKTVSGASAILIQSIDKTALSTLMTELKSPYTIHDSIGLPRTGKTAPKETPAKIQQAVTKAYAKIQKADFVGELEKQMTKHIQHLVSRNKMHTKEASARITKIKQATEKLRKLQNIKTYSLASNKHFEAEPHKQFKTRKK